MESMDSGKTISTSEEATRKLNERKKKIGNKIIIMSMVSLRTCQHVKSNVQNRFDRNRLRTQSSRYFYHNIR